MGKFQDLTGQRFGRLVVVKQVKNTQDGYARWLCNCDCGKEKIVKARNLKRGGTKSCGCIQKEKAKNTCETLFMTHGLRKTPIYGEWNTMKQRCYNPKVKKYKRYGGRGIKVCDEWLNDFQAFYEYVSKLPHFGEKGYSLNRINNNGNYEPNNVEWATQKEQSNNRQSNHLLTYNGKTQTMKQWATECNIKYGTLERRINRFGWSVEKALTASVRSYKLG